MLDELLQGKPVERLVLMIGGTCVFYAPHRTTSDLELIRVFTFLSGSGKSSLANALLDTASLVPRGSFGATTSVPIETAWHSKEHPEAKITTYT